MFTRILAVWLAVLVCQVPLSANAGIIDGYIEVGALWGGDTLISAADSRCADILCQNGANVLSTGQGAGYGFGLVLSGANVPLDLRILKGKLIDSVSANNGDRVSFERLHLDVVASYQFSEKFKLGLGYQKFSRIKLNLTDVGGGQDYFDKGKGRFIEADFITNPRKSNKFIVGFRFGKAEYIIPNGASDINVGGTSNGVMLGIQW